MTKLPNTYAKVINLCDEEDQTTNKVVTFSIPNGVPSIKINEKILFKTCHCFGDSSYPKLGLLDNGVQAKIVEGLTCNKCSRAWGTK
jgi:hypothetical protein